MKAFLLILLVLAFGGSEAASLDAVRTGMDSLLKSERPAWMELNKGRTDSVTAILDLRFRVDVLGNVAGVEVDSSSGMPAEFQSRILSKLKAMNFGTAAGTTDLFTYSLQFQYQGSGGSIGLGRDFWIRMGVVAGAIVAANLLLGAIL